ncbi:MAG: S41 family peptidase [Steroidobacteraceae bacterium]
MAPTTPITPSITYTPGVFPAASTFANQCQTPRTGINPATGRSYPDVQGSSLAEKHFLRSWTNNLYLWYDEVTDRDPNSVARVLDYFDTQKTTAILPDGSAKDRYHFTYDTATYYALSESGVSVGYGINWDMVSSRPPRQLLVQYVEQGSQAAMAGVTRGAQVLRIDNVDFINDGTQAGVDVLNKALSESSPDVRHNFVFADRITGAQRTVSLAPAAITLHPVPVVRTQATASGPVGYLLFQDHIATAEKALVEAFDQLKAANVQDLVLDLRYNGGGYLAIASEVAYMIAGSAQTRGKTFERVAFNGKHPVTNPVTGESIAPYPFLDVAQGFSVSKNQALPTLSLSRVYVLTSEDTCSASESIINSLRGIGVEVIQIGADTCGKPYGFYPQDNCGTTYFSIQFKGVNALGFGDYPAGFSPAVRSGQQPGAKLPGCEVGDDYNHDLGDSAERMFKVALDYRATGGSCALAMSSSGAAPRVKAAAAADGEGIPLSLPTEPWRNNRIYR